MFELQALTFILGSTWVVCARIMRMAKELRSPCDGASVRTCPAKRSALPPTNAAPRSQAAEQSLRRQPFTAPELPRDDRHKIRQVQGHAVDVLDLNVLILHEHAGHPRASGNAAATGFEGKKRLVCSGHFPLDAKHGLAASIQSSKVT